MAEPKILYIEDNKTMRAVVRGLLEARGFKVFEAEDGINGLEVAEKEIPDLILMDMNIPGMDGYASATKLKSVETLQQIPIVAITSYTGEGEREKTLIAGCDGYIKKPIDIENFPEQITEYLHGKRETVKEKERADYLKDYSTKLVKNLEQTIRDLKKSNELLKQTNIELQNSNKQLDNKIFKVAL